MLYLLSLSEEETVDLLATGYCSKIETITEYEIGTGTIFFATELKGPWDGYLQLVVSELAEDDPNRLLRIYQEYELPI